MGCRGINIEPNKEAYNLFKKYRKKDINLNIGVADYSGEGRYYSLSEPALNTFSLKKAKEYEQEYGHTISSEKKVIVETVKSILKKYWQGKFPDFLSIDTEGSDLEILKTIDFNNDFPIVICAETISYSNRGLGEKDIALVSYLEDNGYLNYADTYINTIFVRKNFWQL